MPDTSSPNYLTVDATGAVGALFTGGVQLNEQTLAAPPPANSLEWVDATGNVHEFIYAQKPSLSVHHRLHVVSQPDSPDFAELILTADDTGAKGSAALQINLSDSTAYFGSATILDTLSRSCFLQAGGPNKLSITGSGSDSWNGTSANSVGVHITLPGATGTVNGLACPSNLSSSGKFVAPVLALPLGGGVVEFAFSTVDGTVPAAGVTVPFTYLIWGN